MPNGKSNVKQVSPDTRVFFIALETPKGLLFGRTAVGARQVVHLLRDWPWPDRIVKVVQASR